MNFFISLYMKFFTSENVRFNYFPLLPDLGNKSLKNPYTIPLEVILSILNVNSLLQYKF